MSWSKDKSGKLVWTEDGKGNPNKPGDNVTPVKVDNSVTSLLGLLSSSSGSSNLGKYDITSNEYDVSGLGLPKSVTGGKTKLDADTFIKALRKTAETDPQTWAGIQYAMYKANYYGTELPNLGHWDPTKTTDLTAVKNFMESLTASNSGDPTVAAPVSTFLTNQQNEAIRLGGNSVRSQIAKVQVPNTTDLAYIADKAFRDVLGMGATEKQRKQFAASFQSQVMSAARASQTAAQSVPTVPSAPVAAASAKPEGFVGPVAPTPEQATLQENLASANLQPQVQMQSVQAAPDANVAAAEFARKADPTQAGVNGLNAAVDTWFKSLGGKGTK